MKKIWMIASIACIALMVSCASAVEKKAEDIVKRSYEASSRGDWGAVDAIIAEEQAYFNSLTAEEQIEYNKAALKAASGLL